mmetsp:Transcript_40298/g.97304  ORF Transcript_40298/g.97304 Transcript_40298/m.97304 type:complete len:306 (+) Transcript_40298:151-1068(+)
MHHLELAISENTSKTVLLTYNLCMTKLQAANCVLQKLTRNIRRTAKEVEEALNGLEQSLKTVEEILAKKKDQSLKVPIATSTLDDFLNHCRSNIDSAKSHLEEERRREKEVNELRELQRLASESSRKQQELEEQLKKETEAKKQEERDSKAREKMSKIQDLQAGWEMEKAATEQKKTKKAKTAEAPPAEDVLFPEEEEPVNTKNLFEDSDDSDNEAEKPKSDEAPASKPDGTTQEDLFGADSSDDEDVPAKPNVASEGKKNTTQEELFGDSSDESDEELVPSSAKRSAEEDSDEQPQKKQKVAED